MKRSICAFLCVLLLLGTVSVHAESDAFANPFVSKFCSSASMAENRAVFAPIESGGFGAGFTGTMAAQVLYHIYNGIAADGGTAFSWAVDKGIAAAELGESVLSREQLCVILKNYLGAADMELPAVNDAAYFYDSGMMTAESVAAATVMQRGGVMAEAADGNFYPGTLLTVADAETVLLRFLGGMRRTFPTAPVGTVTESPAVDDAWFDDVAVIGHSQAVGMSEYFDLKNISYFAVIGHRAQEVLEYPWYKTATGRMGNIRQAMERGSYGKIYILLGVNDFTDRDDRIEQFKPPMRQLLEIVREYQPDAEIYLISVLPVGRVTKNNYWFNPQNVILYSQAIKDLSREFDTQYIDLFRFMCDDDGYMTDNFNAGDGIHILGKVYYIIEDYLKTHT